MLQQIRFLHDSCQSSLAKRFVTVHLYTATRWHRKRQTSQLVKWINIYWLFWCSKNKKGRKSCRQNHILPCGFNAAHSQILLSRTWPHKYISILSSMAEIAKWIQYLLLLTFFWFTHPTCPPVTSESYKNPMACFCATVYMLSPHKITTNT